MLNFCSLYSGSSGNSLFVETENTKILIDAGMSCKKIEEGLQSIEVDTSSINAILVTHEHADHIQGLGVLSRRYGIPIYATKGTIAGILSSKGMGEIDTDLFNVICVDQSFTIDELNVNPVKISHDANEPCAYRISNDLRSVGICTDLGTYNDYIVDSFRGVNAILLEANHDVNMLQVGRYPYQLKRRILSDKGHLSNENSGRLLCEILHDDLSTIMLGHLSEENNLAELAYETVRLEILMNECKYKPEDFELLVASRTDRSKLIAV